MRELPSKETIEYGRRAVQRQLDIVEKWIAEKPDAEGRWGRAAYFLRRLLGDEGCVVGAFDARLLDDDFRAMLEDARPISDAREAAR